MSPNSSTIITYDTRTNDELSWLTQLVLVLLTVDDEILGTGGTSLKFSVGMHTQNAWGNVMHGSPMPKRGTPEICVCAWAGNFCGGTGDSC